MARLSKPIWSFLPGYFVSTNDTPDHGLETMVYPAAEDACVRYNRKLFLTYTHGVDYENPYEEYTQHYNTVQQAEKGHRYIVERVKERIEHENA